MSVLGERRRFRTAHPVSVLCAQPGPEPGRSQIAASSHTARTGSPPPQTPSAGAGISDGAEPNRRRLGWLLQAEL
jgi:hypothetical protein